jgi:glycerophosphoryl diester phosphodiesterase
MSENKPSRPLILGHRGASAYAPENTLAAFRLAREQGADGVELDAKLSADGFVIVMHDATVDRTTNGTGKVSALTYYELRRLDAGGWYNQSFRGEPIPTLEEVFAAVGRDLLVNVELTNYTTLTDKLPEKVAALVIRMDLERQVIFSSFSPPNLVKIHTFLPAAPLALLTPAGAVGALSRFLLGGSVPKEALHPHYADVTASLVERYHKKGRKVNVWTVNDAQEMRRLQALRVDAIITDDPLLARQTLENRS